MFSSAFAVLFLLLVPANEATQLHIRQAESNPAVGDIAAKLPPGFSIASADADANGSVTWKELYDALEKLKIPNLDTGVVKGLITKFAVDGAKEGKEAGLDSAEFSKMLAYLKKKSADALIPKDLNAFDTGCYTEETKGETYRGLVSSTVSGRTCQKWLSDHPHKEALDNEPNSDNGLGNHNFCRNPDGSEEKPWCYTQDPTVKKEVCEIPVCPGMERNFQDEADDLAKMVAEGLECDCAAQMYGDSTTTADTAVPLSLIQQHMQKKCRCPRTHHSHKRSHHK